MKWSALFLVLVIGAAALLATPLLVVNLSSSFAAPEKLSETLRLYLMTVAFVGALWAVYLRENRLRANSENVLISLITYVVALALLCLATIFAFFAGADHLHKASEVLAYVSLEVYAIATIMLIFIVFAQTYNQLYNLRTNKFFKYFKPFRWLRKVLGIEEAYSSSMDERTFDPQKCVLLQNFSSEADRLRLKQGACILVTGHITDTTIDQVLIWVGERLHAGETANYVSGDRHPLCIWKMLKPKMPEDARGRLVFIDAYGPSFGFTDDIHEKYDKEAGREGVAIVRAKTFAGLHSATNSAFNILRANENKQRRDIRRPGVIVYANTSALVDLESIDQFRIFWRHVVPAERSYGMITFIIEDESAGEPIIGFLKYFADFVFKVEHTADSPSTLRRER